MRGRERRGLAYRFASFAGAALVALATLVGTPNVTAHAGECVAPPTGSVSFLPTSQLTDGSTLVADDGASVAIGELPSLLPSLPGAKSETVDMVIDGATYPLDLIRIPQGSVLHRAMVLPTTSTVAPDDVRNTLAADTTWFGDLRVARIYANSSWGHAEGRVVVSFETTRPLVLMNLASMPNLNFLWASVGREYRQARADLDRLTGPSPPTRNPVAVQVARDRVAALRRDLNVIRLTTGYDATWADQVRLNLRYGDAITTEPDRSPEKVFAERGIGVRDAFAVRAGDAGLWRVATLVSGCPGTDSSVTWGPGRAALNRLSFSAALDRVLTDAIARSMNVDGYIAPAMPSLLNPRGALLEEVAIFSPRGSLIATGVVP